MKVYQGDLNLIGERHGFGKFITPYYVLIGMWKNDKFCGWGRESRCNGDTFEVRFENGLINGKGIFMNKMNSKYVGDFKNMKRWGKGKLQTDKIIYEGGKAVEFLFQRRPAAPIRRFTRQARSSASSKFRRRATTTSISTASTRR